MLDNIVVNQQKKLRLEQAIEQKENILITGEAGSGKTAIFHMLLNQAASKTSETIVAVVEDQNIEMRSGNLVYILGKNNEMQSKLLQKTPKLTPEWVAVDEIKGTAAVDMLAALACGYAGIMTLEAHSAYHALTTLEEHISAKVKPDERMITDRIDLIVCVERTETGSRQVKEVAELRRYAFSEYQLTYI